MGTLSLNTNLSALATQRRLGQSTIKLSQSFERLSSGLRINKASDDAAGLSISESLRTDSRVFSQGVRNLNDGVSVTNIAESTLNELTNIVTRIQELAEQSANGTLANKQRASLDAEAQALAKEFFRVSRVAEFNGLRLFDGSTQGLRFQAGYGDQGGLSTSLGGKLGTGTISGTATYSAEGALSRAVRLSDLNGDGLLDLVTAGRSDSSDGYATVRLGRGDGSFGSATSYTTESSISNALALCDLNGDGLLDLVTAGQTDSNDGYATIRLGRGDGTFGQTTSYATENYSSNAVSLEDLNGDRVLDLVTAGRSESFAGYATVRLGLGDGTFGQAASFTMETRESKAVALADFNGDGLLDLVTAGEKATGGGFSTVRLGRGDGTFDAAKSYAGGNLYSTSVALGDLNGDGFFDLVTGEYTTTSGYATVRLGQGDGTFGQAVSFTTETMESFAVSLGDLNGDGLLDLMSAGYSSSYHAYATIRLGQGDGTFGSATSTRLFSTATLNDFPDALATGDLNNDGVLDFVGAGTGNFGAGSDGVVQILLGQTREGIAPLLPFSLRTKADALQAIPLLSQALTRTSMQRGTIGAMQSRIGTALSNLQVASENYDSASSQIKDVDVACESAELLKTQIVQSAGAAVLSQANLLPSLALTLLRK